MMTHPPEPTSALDAAHAAMEAAPENDTARMTFHARIADSELFLMLESEAEAETLEPRVFPLDSGPVVLAFDSEERLAEFASAPVPYAALPGRVLVRMMAGQGLGLGLNLDVAPSSTLLPPAALDWLAATLAPDAEEIRARPEELLPPHDVPEPLLAALDTALARGAGLADSAWLARARYADGAEALLLALIGTAEGAERALTRALDEALRFSAAEEAHMLDIVHLAPGDALLARLQRIGLRFDLPAAAQPEPGERQAPGADPTRPPRLR